MDKQEMNYFAEKLMKMKEEIFNQLRRTKEVRKKDSLREDTQELSITDNHLADTASEVYERSKNLALDEKNFFLIQQIDRALEKILEGNYGICMKCGNHISRERLKAIPYTELCIACKGKIEGLKKMSGPSKIKVNGEEKRGIDKLSSNK